MTLYRKIGIAVLALLILVFVFTLVINAIESSRYLSEQLSIENRNDATETAQSLTLAELDRDLLEIRLDAKYGQGTYRRIALVDANNSTLFSRESEVTETSYPKWLRDLLPINAEPGVAEVSSGWSPLGYVVIERYDDVAYDELWEIAKNMLIALLLAVVVAGILGNIMLRRILEPLKAVVAQAQAIGERRFISTTEPSTTEFAEVTRAMNELARRVRDMLEKESQRLSRQREVASTRL